MLRSAFRRFGIFLMRAASAVVVALWLIALVSQPALAEKRVALVIGNSAYKNVARLNNPANDAAAVAGILTDYCDQRP
jgi:hypothetical protein